MRHWSFMLMCFTVKNVTNNITICSEHLSHSLLLLYNSNLTNQVLECDIQRNILYVNQLPTQGTRECLRIIGALLPDLRQLSHAHLTQGVSTREGQRGPLLCQQQKADRAFTSAKLPNLAFASHFQPECWLIIRGSTHFFLFIASTSEPRMRAVLHILDLMTKHFFGKACNQDDWPWQVNI